ncbi:MAG: calcium/sodium antiporter [Sodaliphilus sp.]|nr:calcium/sodium antiporter [Sodaliphilus sp.]
MDYILLLIGLFLLLYGANYLVDASVAIAQRAKVSNFIIGLTIVGMGTSAPELFVSVSSALTGHGDVAMGNVIGSNISNILLILGVTALILPFSIEKEQQRRDLPVCIGSMILLTLLANDALMPGITVNEVSRLDGVMLLLAFLIYMCYVIVQKAKHPEASLAEANESSTTTLGGKQPWLLWTITVVSLAALIGGGQLFLNSAQNLAEAWGISQAVISITVVAIGTSLPELITAVVAACKKNPQLALGNVIGSNVFNALFITGTASVIKPFTVQTVQISDYAMAIVASVMCYLVAYTFKKKTLDRAEGAIFLLAYIAYTAFLLLR